MRALAAALAVLLAAGCATTFDGRVAKAKDAFDALSPADQERVRGGTIERGDSTDIVFIALGSPDRRTQSTSGGQAVTERWEYDGWMLRSYTATGGKPERVELGPNLRLASTSNLPPSERRAVEPVLALDFVDGRLQRIENRLDEGLEYVRPLARPRP